MIKLNLFNHKEKKGAKTSIVNVKTLPASNRNNESTLHYAIDLFNYTNMDCMSFDVFSIGQGVLDQVNKGAK